MSLNKWKAWPVEILEDMLKINKKTCDHKKRILWPVFGQNKIFWTQQCRGWTDPKIFLIDFDMERRNLSSYAKTRPVLRTDSELEDKMETMRLKVVVAAMDRCKQWR